MGGALSPAASAQTPASPEILGLTADSREVRPGWLFAALPGTKLDGRRFISDAVARGAIAILTDMQYPGGDLAALRPPVALVADANPRRRLALMAARFHAPQPKTVAAVTGTNGKTSVTAFARQIWQATGVPSASLGTIGIVAPGHIVPGSLTTPDAVTLHRELAALARRGVDHVAIEASSHGIDQFRLDGLALAAAAFTNLTRDHLDYHGTMAAYGEAKLRLFRELLPEGGVAVLNAESDAFDRFAATCRARHHRIFAFGERANCDLRILARRPLADGQELDLDILGTRRTVRLPLVGAFQASNVLAALGLALGCGVAIEAALEALASLDGVPGRMQRVAILANGAAIYVDFAHTPDALDTVLRALRPHASGRLIVVFGAGGDRDPLKRPLMGEAVAQHADLAVVTDDNPRGEPPAAIRAAVLAGCPGAREIGDRAAAIRAAIEDLRTGDILVIAGKGHESGQTIAGVTYPFDDVEVARGIAAALPRETA